MDNLFVFIMAGGSGERFWPMSRKRTPKHLLRLVSDRTLLEEAVLRAIGVVPSERVFVLTNRDQLDACREAVPCLRSVFVESVMPPSCPPCLVLRSPS